MSVRKFLLPLGSPASGEVALHTALLLTKRWNAHLHVLHIRTDTRDIAPLASEGMSGAMIEEMIQAAEKDGNLRTRNLQQLFLAATTEHEVKIGEAEFGVKTPSASFSSVAGRDEEIIAYHARLSDLTIVPHPAAGEDVASADALHAVLFDSGRPVMLSPITRPVTIGTRIAVAWNGLSNAAAALGSAMPYIREAEAVRVLTSPEYWRKGPGAEQVVNYIAHQGVTADIGNFSSIDREVGAGLLHAAGGFGDLMSMGAYSSSRLRQLILGGVTRYVLENADLPGDHEQVMYGVDNPRTIAAVRAYVKLARASRAVNAGTEARLSAAGITHTQLGVLEALLHLGKLTQRALIDKVLTSPGNMTDVIDKLEQRGYVARCRPAADRRNVEVGLTETGTGFIQGLFPAHAKDIAATMAALTDAEIATLDALLRRLGKGAAACNKA